MNSAIQAAKEYLENIENHLTHMSTGNYRVNDHNTDIDSHIVSHLPGVDESHIDTSPYSVVTVSKDITTDSGITIPKVVQLEVDASNKVQNVLESK